MIKQMILTEIVCIRARPCTRRTEDSCKPQAAQYGDGALNAQISPLETGSAIDRGLVPVCKTKLELTPTSSG